MDSAAAFKAVPRHFDPSSRRRMETVLRQCFVGSVGETRAGKNAERKLHVVLG
ncbi:hypothetical protein DIPPA_22949 [Diplonema papillatum]|nr:hypothetical protein DIPPA_22949 [Diplonema papillatum]